MTLKNDEVRIGLVGTGRGIKFARIVERLSNARLACVFDPAETTREAFLKEFPGVAVAQTFEDLLDGRVDAVFLASPQQYHGPQAIAALSRNVHVLSEIPPVVSVEQAQALVAAVRSSHATFMLAENHCYIPHNLIVGEMVKAGLFGDIYYAESEYLYEVRDWQTDAEGKPTWRSFWHVGKNAVTYPTHSLGPLLQWLGTRLESVSALGAGHTTNHAMDNTLLLLGRTPQRTLITMRLDILSYRPPEAAYLSFQSSLGAFDSGRGPYDRPRVYIRGTSPHNEWEPLEGYFSRFQPARYKALFEDARLWKSPYGPALDFIEAIRTGTRPPLDVYGALDMMLPGIVSETALAAGSWVAVPNPRFFTDGIHTGPGREWPLA